MSLSNIKLPGFVIADLYRNSLIQPEGFAPAQETQLVAEPEPVGLNNNLLPKRLCRSRLLKKRRRFNRLSCRLTRSWGIIKNRSLSW